MKKKDTEIVIFAGGCFWCIQKLFEKTEGVIKTTCGYTGGYIENPTYERVSSRRTGHYEAVKIVFDRGRVTYKSLLNIFFENIDPTNREGQFCDTGNQYLPAIFFTNRLQKSSAECYVKLIERAIGESLNVKILKSSAFYPAEEYHQYYFRKCPTEYRAYYNLSGREKLRRRLKRLIDSISNLDRC